MAAFGRASRFAPLLGLCALLAAAGGASGADSGSGPPVYEDRALPSARPWTVTFAPYGWMPGLNGSTTAKGRTTDIDVGPFQVLEHIDGVPGMGYAEARSGPLALYSDIIYAPLSVGASRARSFDHLSLDVSGGVDIRETIIEAGVAYEIGKWQFVSGWTAVDLLAGARYWRESADINLALTAALDTTGLVLTRGRAIARSGDVEWVDPLVGLRLRHQLALGQELLLRGDVGGFDAGSQFSWNVLAAYSFQIGAYHGVTYSGLLGYRALAADFVKGSDGNRFEFDMIQHGPLLGLVVSF
jgi:hypothetical protein